MAYSIRTKPHLQKYCVIITSSCFGRNRNSPPKERKVLQMIIKQKLYYV